jgi:hypothetical protein
LLAANDVGCFVLLDHVRARPEAVVLPKRRAAKKKIVTEQKSVPRR